MFRSVDPFTGSEFAAFELSSDVELFESLSNASMAFQSWKKLPLATRCGYFLSLAGLLKRDADKLAVMAASEMGKLAPHAKAEILKSAGLCEYYAQNASRILQTESITGDNGAQVELSYQPLGVILGVFPWNFPYWQILRSAVPTLISGNAMLVKPAPNVPSSSLLLQQLIDEAGIPSGIYQTIFADEKQVANLIADDRISGTTLTGSERAGSAVASLSGKHIKPSVLELGGSDATIILNDAPLELIIDQVVFARFQNNGQSCVAAKRFLVQKEVADKFTDLLIEKVTNLKSGDPKLWQGIDLGPLARKDLLDLLVSQVNDSVAAGAEIVFRNSDIPAGGYFFPPTILSHIPVHSRAYSEELFGPVVGLYVFDTDEDAVALVNDTRFGLGASIYSASVERARKMAADIETGMVYINQMVKSDVRFPFGGVKKSGYGRELGDQGLRAFCQVKSTWIKKL